MFLSIYIFRISFFLKTIQIFFSDLILNINLSRYYRSFGTSHIRIEYKYIIYIYIYMYMYIDSRMHLYTYK